MKLKARVISTDHNNATLAIEADEDVVVGMSGADIEYVLRAMRGGHSISLIQRVKGDRDGRVVAILNKPDADAILYWLALVKWADDQHSVQAKDGER